MRKNLLLVGLLLSRYFLLQLLDSLVALGELLDELFQVLALFRCTQGQKRGLKAISGTTTGFRRCINIIEESEQGVKVLLGERIIFVIVTGGAMDRHPHEGGANGGDTIDHVLEETLLGQRGPAVDNEMQSIETRSNELVAGRIGEQVASQLIANEVVVAQILVESAYHPVAVGDEVAVKVLVHAVGVGKTNQVQPIAGKVLSILFLGQQSVDERLVRLGTIICQERLDFLARGRQPGQVEGDSANQGTFVRFFGWLEAQGIELGQDQTIDGKLAQRAVLDLGHLRFLGRNECPKALIGSTRFDPTLDNSLLLLRERFLVRLRRRHQIIDIIRGDPIPKLAVLDRAWLDSGDTVMCTISAVLAVRLI